MDFYFGGKKNGKKNNFFFKLGDGQNQKRTYIVDLNLHCWFLCCRFCRHQTGFDVYIYTSQYLYGTFIFVDFVVVDVVVLFYFLFLFNKVIMINITKQKYGVNY